MVEAAEGLHLGGRQRAPGRGCHPRPHQGAAHQWLLPRPKRRDHGRHAPAILGGKDDPQYKGTQHGQPFPYDTHIPCIYYGWNVPHGETTQETHITDIAATVCALLHIQMPNGCIGTPTQLK